MFSPILLPAWDSLVFLLRSPFFFLWNLLVITLIFILNFITFFDFEGESVPELFFSTIVLSGAVNAAVFHLSSKRGLDLLLLRPVPTLKIVLGRFLGLMTFQVFLWALFVAVESGETVFLGRKITSSYFWSSAFALLQVGMLSALFGLIGVWLESFWALAGMVAFYLAGHLSSSVLEGLPRGLSTLASLFFCLVPDLELFIGINSHDRTSNNTIYWELSYRSLYILLILYIWSISLRIRVFKVGR
jgi:hypothetical protein